MPAWIGRLLRDQESLAQLDAFFREEADEWDCLPFDVLPQTFGHGSRRAFAEYFQGASHVGVRHLDDVCTWLRGCECVSDQALFFETDYWQHPVTFEQLRRGDCEDHALWAWRKLAELKLAPHFVAGRWRGVAHTWVLVDTGQGLSLVETTEKSGPMVQPLPLVRSLYCPAVAIAADLSTYVFRGFRRFHDSGIS